jgi:enoyl-CoA hydratase/carnithine racemase
MTYEQIIYMKKNWLATISLNRPAKLNALTDQMMTELRKALLQAEADEEIRVVVIKGEGRAFSAGFDVTPTQHPRTTTAEWREHFSNGNSTFRTIWNLSKPVIAQVHGACLGGGFDLTMACDITICSEDAFFGEPEVRFGGTSMFLLLPWLVSMKTAKHILLTGDNIYAQQALQYQIVQQVVPLGELEEAVEKFARRLAAIPLGTVPLNKKLLNRAYELMGMEHAVQMSEEASILGITSLSDEAKEFESVARRDGLKAAIAWRDAKYI